MNRDDYPKTVLVLGANSGIGLAFVKHYLKTDNVVAISRNTGNLLKLSSKKLNIIKADLSKEIPDLKNPFDIIINCIGIASFKPFRETTKEDLDQMINYNIQIPILTTQKYLNNLQMSKNKKKTMIQIGSLAGLRPGHKNFSLYSTTKMALLGFYNSLSAEYGEENIRFILIAPHAYKSNICKHSIGGTELQKLLDHTDLISADEMVLKIISRMEANSKNLLPLIIEK